MGQSQPTVSRHLKFLSDAGYLTRWKRGTHDGTDGAAEARSDHPSPELVLAAERHAASKLQGESGVGI